MELLRYIESQEYTQIVILSKLRRIGGIKLEDASDAMNISKSLLSLLESGKREASEEQIQKYSDFLQDRLGLKKSNLYHVIKKLSKDHKVTSSEAKTSPIDFLFKYLKECCDNT